MKPIGRIVLAAILAFAVAARHLLGAAASGSVVAPDREPDVPSLAISAQLPMYPAFGPPLASHLES